MINRTYSPKLGEVERHWYVIDAAGTTLGRLSTVVARVLMGKHKPQYAPHVDTGDFVIIVNADQAVLTGKKEEQKIYYRHSGQPGKLKAESAQRMRARRPSRMVELAVRGMLPKNRLGRRQLKKLKVYDGQEHPHGAQKPAELDIVSVL